MTRWLQTVSGIGIQRQDSSRQRPNAFSAVYMANESKRNSSGLALRSSRREMEAEGFETTKIIVEEDDDDPPMLSSQALEALKEFMNEQQQSIVDESVEIESSEVALVAEDWRLSQFWYDRETAAAVAEEVRNLSLITASPVACIACPTLYAYLKKYYPDISVQLLEYDKRFEQYGRDFTYYDYNQPKELPLEMRHGYRVIIADPPYLSKECLEKVAETMTYLAQPGECYLLLLTGEVQRERAAEILNLYPCGFRPQHSSKLGNDFRLFTNYDPRERLGGWERD